MRLANWWREGWEAQAALAENVVRDRCPYKFNDAEVPGGLDCLYIRGHDGECVTS